MSTLNIPTLCLAVLVDTPDATGVLSHFAPDEVLRLQTFVALLGGDAPERARALMRDAVEHRLALGRLTAVEAGAMNRLQRQEWVRLAKSQHVPAVALTTTGARLDKEGFVVRRLDADISGVTREVPASHRHEDAGPFDIIGDVHGCASELLTLLARLGYRPDADGGFAHPEQRRVVFLGDLVDRGPDAVGALRIAMGMVRAGRALCIEGNHEAKLIRKLRGKNVKLDHGLERTWAQLETHDDNFRAEVLAFLAALPHHLVLHDGQLVCAHAGLAELLQGRDSGRVRSFALYGDTTGESDADGLPVRRDWASQYRGEAAVIYGHTPVSQALWRNGTLCIDTGCVFGGELTALRWPERELVSVPAEAEHYPPPRALAPPPTLPRLEGALTVEPWEGAPVRVSAAEVDACEARLAAGGVPAKALITLASDSTPTAATLFEALAEYLEAGVSEVLLRESKGDGCATALLVRGAAAASRFGVPEPGIAFDAQAQVLTDDSARLAEWAEAADLEGLFDALASEWLLIEGALGPAGLAGLAPHCLLASEGRLHVDRDREQHLNSLVVLGPTSPYHRVHVADRAAWDRAAQWVGPRSVTATPLEWRSVLDEVPAALRIADADRPHVGGRHGKRARWRAARRQRLGLEAARRFVVGDGPGRVRECILAALATP